VLVSDPIADFSPLVERNPPTMPKHFFIKKKEGFLPRMPSSDRSLGHSTSPFFSLDFAPNFSPEASTLPRGEEEMGDVGIELTRRCLESSRCSLSPYPFGTF